MGKLEGSKFFVSVYNCRLCGCIMSSKEGVHGHEQVCRLPEKFIRNKCQQMNLVQFPCPIVTLTRIPPSSNSGRIHPPRALALALDVISQSRSPSIPENSNEDDDECISRPEDVDEEEEEEWSRPVKAKTKGVKVTENHLRANSSEDEYIPEDEEEELEKQPRLVKKVTRKNVTKNQNQKNNFVRKNSSSEGDDNFTEDEDDDDDDHFPAKKKKTNKKGSKNIRLIQTKAWGKTIHKKVTVNEETHKYLCPVKECGSRLKHLHQLRLHFITHLKNNPFACPVPNCTIRCDSTHHFRQHIDWHLGRNILTCEKCSRTFAHPTKLKRHKCKPKRRYKGFKRSIMSLKEMTEVLKGHYANLESKGLYNNKADVNKLDDDNDNLGLKKLHQRIDIDKIIQRDPVFLQISKENPEFRENLLKPIREKNHVKEFQCSVCDKSYQNARNMRDHYNFMHRKRPYKCKLCGKTFVKECDLEVHKRYHEGSGNLIYMKQLNNGAFQCTKCKFESKSKQGYHMRRHWLRVHNVSLPLNLNKKDKKKMRMKSENFKKSSKRSNMSPMSCEGEDLDLSLPVIKIESEPALQLAMIIPEDVKPIKRLKIDPDSQHQHLSESSLKRELKADVCVAKNEIFSTHIST